MIITSVIGNTQHEDDAAQLAHCHVETVYLDSADLLKKIQRLTTDHGNEIGLRLSPAAPPLVDGDILYREGNDAIIIKVLATDIIVIFPRTMVEMGFIAHSLGNRHLPAQFFAADAAFEAPCMVVQADTTVQDFLEHHKIPFRCESRVMEVPFRHAEHTH